MFYRQESNRQGSAQRVGLKLSKLLLTAALLLLVAACNRGQAPGEEGMPMSVEIVESPLASPDSPLSSPNSPLEELEVEAPGGDQTIVIGQLVSFDDEPLPGEVVRLPAVNCPEDVTEEDKRFRCFWALDDAASPSAITDENGIFVFDSVPAQDYVLLIGDIMNRYTLIQDQDERAVIYTAAPGGILELGQFAVDF